MGEPKLADLDRCVHGRHLADPCFGCPDGQSAGNPYLFDGRRIGTDYAGMEIRLERVCRLDPGTDQTVLLTVCEDGSVLLCLLRDAPPEWLNEGWDGRETGEYRTWQGMLAHMRFASGDEFERWLDQARDWLAGERVKRPWL